MFSKKTLREGKRKFRRENGVWGRNVQQTEKGTELVGGMPRGPTHF